MSQTTSLTITEKTRKQLDAMMAETGDSMGKTINDAVNASYSNALWKRYSDLLEYAYGFCGRLINSFLPGHEKFAETFVTKFFYGRTLINSLSIGDFDGAIDVINSMLECYKSQKHLRNNLNVTSCGINLIERIKILKDAN